ncbi:L-serine ammonia-lyase [Flavobacterium psychrophilum]|nr:L-serine ammonia-lyase [Flavobacterium psychrophilum]
MPFHANGLRFTAFTSNENEYQSTFYSIGGGFVVKEERENAKKKTEIKHTFPYPINLAEELLQYCISKNKKYLKSFTKTKNRCVPKTK